MSIRATIEEQMQIVAREQEKSLAPLHDDLILLESGLDSLCFAILTARLEDELGADPFSSDDVVNFPVTFGNLVDFYDNAIG
jgi:hypothetical protein